MYPVKQRAADTKTKRGMIIIVDQSDMRKLTFFLGTSAISKASKLGLAAVTMLFISATVKSKSVDYATVRNTILGYIVPVRFDGFRMGTKMTRPCITSTHIPTIVKLPLRLPTA